MMRFIFSSAVAMALVISAPFMVAAKPNSIQTASIAALTASPELISYRGNPFLVHSVRIGDAASNTTQSPRFLVQGGLHGNEVLTSEFVIWLKNRVARGESLLNALPDGAEIDFLPYANPDSYSKSRYNQNNINLNRNFAVLWGVSREPYGKTPFSEPETKAIRSLIQTRRYTAAVDVHGYVNWVVMPSDPRMVGMGGAEKTRQYLAWRNAVKQNMSILDHVTSYELKLAGFLGDGGAFEDWAFWGGDALAICLEMAEQTRFASKTNGVAVDTFMQYEKYIHKLFTEAVAIKQHSQLSMELVDKTVPKANSAKAKVHH